MGQSASSNQQFVETTTNTDSFNKTFASTSNINESGNISVNLPDIAGGGSLDLGFLFLPLLIGGLLLTLFLFLKR